MIDAEVIERWMREANPIPTLDDVDAGELTRAVAVARTRRAAAMQAPTQHPIRPSPSVPLRRQRRRKALAFAAAFVLVLFTVGIAALALRSNDAPVADEPVTPTEPVETESLQWSRVPLERLDRDVFMAMDPEAVPEGLTLEEHIAKYETVVEVTDITQGGPGLVAVGWTRQSGEPKATMWTSPDGYTWTRVPHDETVSGTGDLWSLMNDVAVGGPGLVAVGSYGDAAAVWTSPDAHTWTRVPVDDDLQHVVDIVAGEPGLVAVGDDHDIWTSPDGYSWTRVPDDEGVFERTNVNAVTAGGPGLVAVGSDESNWRELPRPLIWTSPDGYTWTRVPYNEADFGPVGSDGLHISDVTAGGPGLVAVGGDGERGDGDANYARGAAVWTSPDGYAWSRVPHDTAVFGSDLVEMESVTAGSNGLLAVGGWPSSAMWFSPDGINWSRVPLPTDVFGEATSLNEAEVAAWGPGFIVVGSEHKDVAIWMSTPTDP